GHLDLLNPQSVHLPRGLRVSSRVSPVKVKGPDIRGRSPMPAYMVKAWPEAVGKSA
ncbi:hypothetical protein HAX54_037128, partial [Datura stramonium]|nr:hypothetical protein [Datura stramonium]